MAAAADELIDILGGNKERDRGTWGYYCYHHDIGIILDKAHEIASRHRQGELESPAKARRNPWLWVAALKPVISGEDLGDVMFRSTETTHGGEPTAIHLSCNDDRRVRAESGDDETRHCIGEVVDAQRKTKGRGRSAASFVFELLA